MLEPDQGCPTARPNRTDSRLFWRFFLSPFVVPFSWLPCRYQVHSSQDCPWYFTTCLYLASRPATPGEVTQHLALLLFGALLTTSLHLPSPLLLVISSNLLSLSPSWPAINFYLIRRITSTHLTINSMLCGNTLLCPRTLFSSHMGSWLVSPQPREATQLSLFQPHEGLKEHRLGTNYSVSPLQDLPPPLPLLLLLDVPCPDIEAVLVSPCLCPPRGLQTLTRKSTAPPRSCLPNVTSHFHSQVNSSLRTC